jgi:hypothetical protein
VVVLGCVACSPGAPTPAAEGSPTAGSCAWPTLASVRTSNIGIPDSTASYWLQPIVAAPDTRIVISGRYADARYTSLSVYTPGGSPFVSDGVGSSLSDYRITPGAGNLNPWRRSAAPGGRYTVTIRSDVSPSQVNTLPMPPDTTSQHPGYLIYRVYLPAANNSAPPPPTLTLVQGHTAHTLPACRQHNAPIPVPTRPSPTPPTSSGTTPAPTPPQLEFYKPAASTFDQGLPNVDTAYVIAYLVRPPASDVVVVTGRAPTAAPGRHPSPWPAAGEDMRYWSLCIGTGTPHVPTVANTLPGGQTDYGCRADDSTGRDSAGDYTYVIGSESQRADIDRVPNVTFLPFATNQSTRLYLLLLRNMLVSPQFGYSVQNVTQADQPAAAATAMGPYYPHMSVCPLTTLTTRGPKACTS